MMWKSFVFGLIAGAIGLMFTYIRFLHRRLSEMEEVGGDTMCQRMIADGGDYLENYTLSEAEFETMLLLTNFSISYPTGLEHAKWN
jgi:hypothetical protein